MADLSNAEISVEGEHADCNTCGVSFHWEQLTLAAGVYYCDDHVAESRLDSPALHRLAVSDTQGGVRDYSDAIANLIGGLAEVWRMPDA